MEKQDDKTEKLSYGPRKKSVVKKDEHWAMEVLESRFSALTRLILTSITVWFSPT